MLKWLLRFGGLAVLVCTLGVPATSIAATFQRYDIVSDRAFHASDSMSQADVQAFLDAMPGVLAHYDAVDHSGTVKPASAIIYDAARSWGINPKAILCLLEKEQSLLTMRNPAPSRLTKAVGCGIYPGSKNRYPGFGNQIWNGTRKLAQYPTLYHWKPGSKKSVYGKKHVTPANAATFSMYTYNPSINGNRTWFNVYSRYFGDPHAEPWTKPIYRFRDLRTGQRLYTGSEGERWALVGEGSLEATSDGIALVGEVLPGAGRTYDVGGLPTRMTQDPGGSPVYQLYDTKIGGYVYTRLATERDALLARVPGRFEPRGVSFYLAR